MTTPDKTDKKIIPSPNEQRQEIRKECLIPVDYAVQDRIYKDFIQNISMGGAFIESPSPMEIGEQILMTFDWLDSYLPIKSKGTIVHKTRLGFGIKFDSPIHPPAQA